MQSVGATDAPVRDRILDAVRACSERWGTERLTVDDISRTSGVSRATIYRFFPGGKDVLFEALRVRELEEFFADLKSAVTDATTLDDLLVNTVVTATQHLRDDQHLALMLAAEPGTVLSELTSSGVPRIVGYASDFLAPYVAPFTDADQAPMVIDVLVRLTISYFLAPSELVDLGDPDTVRTLLVPFVIQLAGLQPPEPVTADL